MELKEIKTQYFDLAELIHSDTADQKKIANIPSVGVVANICNLITEVLEPARVRLGSPIIVTSGYRCVELNKAVGGVVTSQHTKGQAADLVCNSVAEMKRLFDILKEMDIDQLLYESNKQGKQWIHVSYVAHGKNRQHVNNNYKA